MSTFADGIKLAPSILAADMAHLADQVAKAAGERGPDSRRCHGRPLRPKYHVWASDRALGCGP